MSAGSTGSAIFPKWQLAILIGAPLAIGLGYLIYRNQTTNIDDDKTKKKNLSLKNKSISIDGKDDVSEKQVDKKKQQELESEKMSLLQQAQNYKNEGNVCYKNGKYAEAIQFYDKAIDKCPEKHKIDLAIFYQNRAAAYEMLKKYQQVKADCTKSLEYNTKYTKAYLRRAKAHEQTNDMLDCLDDITTACILETFQNNSTIMYADRILKQTGQNDAVEAMKTRLPLLPSKNFLRTYFRSFINDPIKKINVYSSEPKGFIRAKIALDNENFEDIIPACTEEIETSESESNYKMEAMLLRGTMNLLMGCYTEALQDFNEIIVNDEADKNLRVSALIKRASLNVQTDNKDLGLADFHQAEKMDSNNADIYHQRAQVYTLLDDLSQAVSEYERSCKLSPEHGMAYVQKCYTEYRLAFMSQDQMRLLSVTRDFESAINKYPDCVECYSFMAQVLTDQGQYETADSYFEKAIKMAPDNATIYVHRGIMQLQWNGDIKKTIEYMNKSIEIDDKCELAYETLGTVEVQRGNLDKAVELFEKAIKLAKSLPEMAHLCALRNAANAQQNVTRKLGIDMAAISALASTAGFIPPN